MLSARHYYCQNLYRAVTGIRFVVVDDDDDDDDELAAAACRFIADAEFLTCGSYRIHYRI